MIARADSRDFALIGATESFTKSLGIRCNACGRAASDAKLLRPFSTNRRGKKVTLQWFICNACGSCFCGNDSSDGDEVLHHQTRAHGVLAKFEKYRKLKRPMYDYICRGIVERGLASGNILDVGASFGGFLTQARAAGFTATAVDINPSCVEYLQSQGFEAIQGSSLAGLELGSSGFDVITMIDVPYYFRDQPLEFEKAKALLKPGGYLVVRTTNKRWAIWLARVLAPIRPKWAQGLFARAVVDHAFVQSVGSLSRVLKQCGYAEIFIEPDRTHITQDVSWDAKAAYVFGMSISAIVRRVVLVPGIIVWARRPQN
jgi:SAM-dependent methyltransferase